MKKITTLFALLAFIAMSFAGYTTTSTSKPTVFPTWIVMTHDELVSRNLAKVAHVQVIAWAPSMLYSNTTVTNFTADYVHSEQPRSSEILALLGSQALVYNLARPKEDKVIVWAYYFDKNWNMLFQGATGFKLELDGDGGWRTPSVPPEIPFEATGVKYVVNGLSSVYFVERDALGNQIGSPIYLDINLWDSSFTIPWYLLDRKGELYIQAWDSATGSLKSVAYDAESGQPITPSTVTTTLSAGSFNNFQSVVPQGDLIQPAPIQSYNGYGQSDVVEVDVKFVGWYRVIQTTTEGELPNTVIAWRVGDPTETEVERVAPNQHILIFLEPGMHHLRFTWPNLQSPDSSIPVPTGGGGPKG